MSTIKVIELIGTSDKGWEDAVNQAVQRASKTIRNIRGVDVVGLKCVIEDNKIVEYRANIKLAFVVD